MEGLRYSIGEFRGPAEITGGHVREWTRKIARLPADLRALVTPLSGSQLDTPYRPGGQEMV